MAAARIERPRTVRGPSAGKQVEPMHMDGLSFPAALMWAMAELGLIGTLKPGADAGDSFTARSNRGRKINGTSCQP